MLKPTTAPSGRFGLQCKFDQRLLYLLQHPSEEMIAKTAIAIAEDLPTSDVIKAMAEVAIAQAEEGR